MVFDKPCSLELDCDAEGRTRSIFAKKANTKTLGTTFDAQSLIPSDVALRYSFGKKIMFAMIANTKIEIKSL